MIRTPKKYREMEFKNLLVEFANLLKPKVYVEIGIKKAYTFNAMVPLVEKAIGIDIDINCYDYMNISDKSRFFQGNSKQFVDSYIEEWRGKEIIDFLFIDGDHKYESVLKDFYALIPYVKTHTGLMFMHDTYPTNEKLLSNGYCSNAWKAANEIHQNFLFEIEIVTIPGPWAGLSILRKLGDTSSTACHGWMDKGEEK